MHDLRNRILRIPLFQVTDSPDKISVPIFFDRLLHNPDRRNLQFFRDDPDAAQGIDNRNSFSVRSDHIGLDQGVVRVTDHLAHGEVGAFTPCDHRLFCSRRIDKNAGRAGKLSQRLLRQGNRDLDGVDHTDFQDGIPDIDRSPFRTVNFRHHGIERSPDETGIQHLLRTDQIERGFLLVVQSRGVEHGRFIILTPAYDIFPGKRTVAHIIVRLVFQNGVRPFQKDFGDFDIALRDIRILTRQKIPFPCNVAVHIEHFALDIFPQRRDISQPSLAFKRNIRRFCIRHLARISAFMRMLVNKLENTRLPGRRIRILRGDQK